MTRTNREVYLFFCHYRNTETTDKQRAKADSTLRYSQAVPDPSTNRALSRLTSEVRRDPVHSTRYGRQRILFSAALSYLNVRNQRPTSDLKFI